MAQGERVARVSDAMRKLETAFAAVAELPDHAQQSLRTWVLGEYFADADTDKPKMAADPG